MSLTIPNTFSDQRKTILNPQQFSVDKIIELKGDVKIECSDTLDNKKRWRIYKVINFFTNTRNWQY